MEYALSMINLAPAVSQGAGGALSEGLLPLGFVIDALLNMPVGIWISFSILTVVIAIGVSMYNAKREEEYVHHWRKRRRRTESSKVGRALDFFQLDMSQYGEGGEAQGISRSQPATRERGTRANQLKVHDVGQSGATQLMPSATGDLRVYHASGFSRDLRVTSHWQLGLHPHMSEIIDLLKSNRRYEFPNLHGSSRLKVERLGAGACGGLFAEIHFGGPEAKTAWKTTLNPD